MTGTDLIVLAPWVVFAVALATICLLLLRAHRASGPRRSWRAHRSRRARRPPRTAPDPADPDPDPADPDPQEARCLENNAEARPR
jgi:hypothetical protein